MDVVGVGTAIGRIIIHNIRLDETLMSFTQDWGPITSLSFRTGTGTGMMMSCPWRSLPLAPSLFTYSPYLYLCLSDGPPIVASGSPQGHIAFWDLERRQLVTQHRHAHRTSIAGATFLQGEPILVTNGADNAIKVKNKTSERDLWKPFDNFLMFNFIFKY